MAEPSAKKPQGGPLAIAVTACVCVAVYFAARPKFRDGQMVAIKNVATGKYLTVTSDGYLQAISSTKTAPASQFKLLSLNTKTVSMLRPHTVRGTTTTRLGCECIGAADEHGFGAFCHHWESEHHRPWCYVSDTCKHGIRTRRPRPHKMQHCTADEGYLGPVGWKPAEQCACNGKESIHGFGSYCKGWEEPGQTPWCYVDDTCPEAVGPEGSKFHECVSTVPKPPPSPPPPPSPSPHPPSPPPPPAPPNPPPIKMVESVDSDKAPTGWGTPEGCPCSGYSSKHGYGQYCKGWEVEGQTPWCYVNPSCSVPSTGGSFKHPYLMCTQMPKGLLGGLLGRKLFEPSKLFSKLSPLGRRLQDAVPPARKPVRSATASPTRKLAPPSRVSTAASKARSTALAKKSVSLTADSAKAKSKELDTQEALRDHKAALMAKSRAAALASKSKGAVQGGHAPHLKTPLIDPKATMPVGYKPPKAPVGSKVAPGPDAMGKSVSRSSSVSRGGKPLVPFTGTKPSSTYRPKPGEGLKGNMGYVSPFEATQKNLLSKAAKMPQFALQSASTHGYVEIKGPPNKNAFFAQADGTSLSLSGVFAFKPDGKGSAIALGTGAYLGLCEAAEGGSHITTSLCAGTPKSSKPPKISPAHHPSPHHRRVLISPSKTSEFVLEFV